MHLLCPNTTIYPTDNINMSIIDVGTPPDGFKTEGWTTTVVRFHGFANLTTTRGDYVKSTKFSCLGHQWRLYIYPGGRINSDEGYAAVALSNQLNTTIKIQYGYSVKDADGKEVVYKRSYADEFAAIGGNNAWFTADFAKRSKLLDKLVDGSLVIEVRMMKTTSTDKSITHIPTNPIYKNVLKLFMNEETADVVFEVGGEQHAKGRRKKAKSSTSFHAHRNILQNCAPTLYEMCGKAGGVRVVSITDVNPEVFKHMVYYAYGGKLTDTELEDNAKDIINACDKYGVVHLKLEAEAVYVKSIELTMDNIMDNLLYADSKNLALLKEAAMDYIVKNKTSIIGKVSFDDAPGHLITDVLSAMARGEEQTGDAREDEDAKYVKMRVGTLRKMLDEKGLDVDGSREAMIALLKEHSA